MPASLIKLFLGLTVDTNVTPEVARWKSTFADGTYNTDESRYEFVVGNFLDDQGNPPAAFPDISGGYYNLYINGVLQQEGLSALIDVAGTDTFVINVAQFSPENEATPIVVEFAAFSASSTATSDVVDP